MNDAEAKLFVRERLGDEGFDQAAWFLDYVVGESSRQNLIAASTVPMIWSRHAADSAQLLDDAEGEDGTWIDVGSGAGFPGMIVAIGRKGPTLLVEPRQKRADFLRTAIDQLGLSTRARVAAKRIEHVDARGAIISARAVAGIEPLLEMTHHCAGPHTRWLLPRGTITDQEVSLVRRKWSFMFHVKQSRVSPTSSIGIFDNVRRRR